MLHVDKIILHINKLILHVDRYMTKKITCTHEAEIGKVYSLFGILERNKLPNSEEHGF